ncbi:hypothetical protein [Nitriliruptor alkaliphilus]|uniref:hypothetical protein n=1 Tax=Nitriliruptor alkaliphilus TaxID=427918 RepID=UPI000695C9A0|nr:hypothetical protein [Nitriliruptor alkaliphilus]
MTRTHEQILAHLEQAAVGEGVPAADVDRYIADRLQVPLDYYFAYLLVWGAIEAHRAASGLARPMAGAEARPGGEPR